jgi:hypothetical protein
LRDFDINQVRGVEALVGVQHPLLHFDAFVRAQKKLEYG